MKENNNHTLYSQIKSLLIEIYGNPAGTLRYEYLYHSAESFLDRLTEEQRQINRQFDPDNPYEALKGKIFAIAYPDNIHSDNEYPLITLKKALKLYFPAINGLHILPERTMSHSDIWPQDFFSLVPVEVAGNITDSLQSSGIIDEHRLITASYEDKAENFLNVTLAKLIKNNYREIRTGVSAILEAAWNSHFNDGGFSQKTRAVVDPRFGENSDLIELTKQYATMLDYVVNHLDVDNDYLEEFRKGNNEGDAFVIIYRDRYKQLIGDRILDKTFRPRPYPLFTGMRKYPVTGLDGEKFSLHSCASEMNRIFTANEMEPLDIRLILLLSIYFKIENDQGLSSEDKRIFSNFEAFLDELKLDTTSFWKTSSIQAKQKVFNPLVIGSMEDFLEKLGFSEKYADLFMNDCDHIFGREFYIYTTFSESQADINPLSFDGFKMIVDDLFYLLSSGALSMMRMDAIKYLWKEIGAINFDMEEGNKLIKVIRLLLSVTSPATLPLDEINSPDPIVYSMAKEGGFAYLFGQVNAVPVSFNSGNLQPLIRFNKTMAEKCPPNLLKFVMLSTHDGRSVQGLGVQRSDGHVSIEQFYDLKDIIESRGGKAQFRSVPKGEIMGDTFRKVFFEAGYESSIDALFDLFEPDLIKTEDLFRLKDQSMSESDILEELSLKINADVRSLKGSAAIDFFIQWIINGKTDYELCCTSRSSFSKSDSDGNSLSEVEEAQRLALAQLYVLTQGQDVPAIYLNDLLGLENDIVQYGITGKSRDLNRHKNTWESMVELIENDTFTKAYTEKLNQILRLRTDDGAFYPGSSQFEFKALTDSVFMNHPWHKKNHSLILGNIINSEVSFQVKSSDLKDFTSDLLTDSLTGKTYQSEKGVFSLHMEPFSYIWLK